jgi:hypothetical protein
MHSMGFIFGVPCHTHPRQLVRFVLRCRYTSDELPSNGHRNATRTLENCAAANLELTADDLAKINHAMAVNSVRGTRY